MKQWLSSNKKNKDGVDLKKLKPRLPSGEEGKIELSFVLPVPFSSANAEMALLYAQKAGLKHPEVTVIEQLGGEQVFFRVEGVWTHSIDVSRCVPTAPSSFLSESYESLFQSVQKRIGRPLNVLGLSLNDDWDLVALDLLFSRQGDQRSAGWGGSPLFKIFRQKKAGELSELLQKVKECKADLLIVEQNASQERSFKQVKQITEAFKQEKDLLLLKSIFLIRRAHSFSEKAGFDFGWNLERSPLELARDFVGKFMEKLDEREGKTK